MGIGTILIGIALFVVVVVLIGLPLLERKRDAVEPPSPREVLELEHQGTVRAIRELDLDFRTSKLDEQDYKTMRAAQVQRGAQILRELDAQATSDDIDADIEKQVAALRNVATVCPSCGQPVKKGDRFCANCAYALTIETDKSTKQA
jgi:zinc-ribbon domain